MCLFDGEDWILTVKHIEQDGTIIEGKTRAVKVSKNIKDYLKKLSSIGSLLGGLAVPLAKILPSIL